jgi:hypothetical protein
LARRDGLPFTHIAWGIKFIGTNACVSQEFHREPNFERQGALRANDARNETLCYLNSNSRNLIEIEEPIDTESMRRHVPEPLVVSMVAAHFESGAGPR